MEDNEIFIGDLMTLLDDITKSKDQEVSIMVFAGYLANKLGYSLASGKDGKTNELWAIPHIEK